MAYTDLTTSFTYKSLLNHQKGEQLLANDNYLIASIGSYRHPSLVYVDNNTIDLENNDPSSATASRILFPDGDLRSVDEDTSLTHQYRRLIRTATYSKVATHDSGAWGSITADPWLAIYAVKTTDDSTKFVLACSKTLPTLSNLSTINTEFGTDGWRYLGVLKSGDNLSAAGFLNFNQSGAITLLKNTPVNLTGFDSPGPVMAVALPGTSVTFTYAAGSSFFQIPNNIVIVRYGASIDSSSVPLVTDSAGQSIYNDMRYQAALGYTKHFWIAASKGLKISSSSANMAIMISGYMDSLLGGGSNPLF